MSIQEKFFRDIDLNDRFFNSLKADYDGFDTWFISKSGSKAYVSYNDSGEMDGFLYLKVEDEAITDTVPAFERKARAKLGTFKIDAHGTKLGERFVRLVFQFAMNNNLKEIYVTMVSSCKQEKLKKQTMAVKVFISKIWSGEIK